LTFHNSLFKVGHHNEGRKQVAEIDGPAALMSS